MSFFASAYTIHFDDTMAYGSHHFLTAFKFQCHARESLLFGQQVYDNPGVPECLDGIHLFTADAYSRNLHPAKLGERVAILLTLEEWQRASARFCYRVFNAQGTPICVGFQTLVCADAKTGQTIPLPQPLRDALDQMRDIEEPISAESFRDRVLAGGSKAESLLGSAERETARAFLTQRYPHPQIVAPVASQQAVTKTAHIGSNGNGKPVSESGHNGHTGNGHAGNGHTGNGHAGNGHAGNGQRNNDRSRHQPSTPPAILRHADPDAVDAWIFSGQGAFDAELLSNRIQAIKKVHPEVQAELEACATVAAEMLGGNASGVISGSAEACAAAVATSPELSQVAIHLQNVLGARLLLSQGESPSFLLGHSFGELAAFELAGCFDLSTGIRIVCERVKAVAQYAPPGGGLLSVMADRSTVMTETVLQNLTQLVVAGRNHDRQTVVSGPKEELNQLRAALERVNIRAVPVPSPTAFHHPGLREAASYWLEKMRAMPLQSPKRLLYSPNGRRFVSNRDDIAAILASQLLKPFDLQGAFSDLAEEGANRIVDCGSRGSLAKIAAQSAPETITVKRVEEILDYQPILECTCTTECTCAAELQRSNITSESASAPAERPADETTVENAAERELSPAVAIVGQGCILPGGANSPESLYSAIMEQRSGIVDQREIDPNWSEDFYSPKLTPDRSTSHLGGSILDDQITVPAGVDPEVFAQFSRTQKLLCIALAPCVHGLAGAEKVLCLVGATADGFEDQDIASSLRFAGIDPSSADVAQHLNLWKSAHAEPHDAIQEVFDKIVRPGLEVVLVDAACASSLYSVALGLRALQLYEADAVIAGGVFCPGPGNSCLFSQFRGTTATGLRPFDAHADGVVFSEGAAVVVMRRLKDAQQSGLSVSAMVRGVGLSSDGRSPSANVPQTHGQILSLQRCYENYDIDPASISAIEAHGTSTPVGDSTEVETLRQFFTDKVHSPIPIHSLKGLLGHAGWAAGTASVVAACEYLRTGLFPAQANMTEPSKALATANPTLKTLSQPQPVTAANRCIAVDGFGFGGANAHIVLEGYHPQKTSSQQVGVKVTQDAAAEELVCVAVHNIEPTLATDQGHQGPQGRRFDRSKVTLPKGYMVLPDLADDLDVSQKLAVSLVDGIIAKLKGFDDSLRRETGIVLAQGGKTERGVEATLRILANRLRRQLHGKDELQSLITTAHDSARPSGAYTLQCMMPNVAAGRAALQSNLNGPNFVVDAGDESLEAAMSMASLLLRSGEHSGTKLIVVAAIQANPWRALPVNATSPDEFATAFAITTRRHAEQLKLPIVATVDKTLSKVANSTRSTGEKVADLLASLESRPAKEEGTSVPEQDPFPIHVPVWVEANRADNQNSRPKNRITSTLVIAAARRELVANLVTTLPNHSGSFQIVVVGRDARQVVTAVGDPGLLAVNVNEGEITDEVLAELGKFKADLLLAVDSPKSWDRDQVLADVASDNSLCELMFLLARNNIDALKQGKLGLYSLLVDGWDDVVHPDSGPFAGMLKAIQRELPATRVGTVCTRSLSLDSALEQAFAEYQSGDSDTEIVHDGCKRLVRRLRRAPLATLATNAQPKVPLKRSSVVVATGGARGVTGVLAEALLQDYGCTVVALGRSHVEPGPPNANAPEVEAQFYAQTLRDNPQVKPAEMRRLFEQKQASWEAHRTIEQLAKAGGRIEYLVADLTNRDQLNSAIEQIVEKYGRIDLLLHGAGVQMSKQLGQRTLADFRKTYSVKVQGLRNLVQACYRQLGTSVPVHALTSAYSVFGNDGQHDYGAANETLDRLCGMADKNGNKLWSSIAWLAWDGIGMTRGSEYQVLSKQRQLAMLDAEAGQKIFRNVISGKTRAEINVGVSDSEHVRYQLRTIPASPIAIPDRVIEQRVELSGIACLPFHKVRGVPTLPGAWILDQMVLAGMKLCENTSGVTSGATSVTIEDALFHRFVKQTTPEPNLRVVAEASGSKLKVWMIGDLLHPSGVVLSKDLVFAEASLVFHSSHETLRSTLREMAAVGNRGGEQRLVDPYCQGHAGDVDLSGPFDCLRDIVIGDSGRSARYVPGAIGNGIQTAGVQTAGPQTSGIQTSGLPGLVLDAALRVGAMYAKADELFVPLRIGRLSAPVGSHALTVTTSPHQIRTTAPHVQENGQVRWERTEVLDERGTAQLILDDALATRLR